MVLLSSHPTGILVVPLVGTWIEIDVYERRYAIYEVVPLVGTWIEIASKISQIVVDRSFPSWERGLKSKFLTVPVDQHRRSPRGNVD